MKSNSEPSRYISNAKEILSTKGNKEDGYYQDKKYVRMAGHTAYLGVLTALDEVLKPKKKGRKSAEWYKEELSKLDKKILNNFNTVYEVLHLVMGYDGHGPEKVVKFALESAEDVIQWAQKKTLNSLQSN